MEITCNRLPMHRFDGGANGPSTRCIVSLDCAEMKRNNKLQFRITTNYILRC